MGIKTGFLRNCPKLEKVTVSAGANGSYYTADSGQTLYTMGNTEDWLIWVSSALTSYEMPANIEVGQGAFYNAVKLTNLNISKSSSKYILDNGLLYTKKPIYSDDDLMLVAILPYAEVFSPPENLSYVKKYTFGSRTNNITSAIINNYIGVSVLEEGEPYPRYSYNFFSEFSKLKKVKFIGYITVKDNMFADNISIEEVEFDGTIKYMGLEAFARCPKLVNLHLPPMREVMPRAFYQCQGLRNVVLDTKKGKFEYGCQFGDSMFEQCLGLEKITVTGDGISTIPNWFAMNDGKLKEVILPESCTYISCESFLNCTDLTVFKAPGLKTIEYRALCNVNLSLNDLPSTVETLHGGAIAFLRKMDTYQIPDNIKKMGVAAINVPIRELIIDHNMPLFGKAFDFICDILVLGKNVNKFNGHIFCGENYPKKVVILADKFIKIQNLEQNEADWTHPKLYFKEEWQANTIVYVPDNLVETYKADEYWGQLNIRPLSESGIEDVTADGNGLDVEVADGVVTVNGNEGQSVEIYSLDGKRVAAGVTGQPLNVGKGLHIIRCGSAANKVMVK